ncbi:MAG: SpoIIE family protein phosphatase [Deltaproteobacteria bacterium]|nr:SpoIIE family protein phosphatase [Deltaproteobacteria bacterium]
MTARQRFNLKNRMLVGNVTANLVAAVVIINLVAPFELTVVTYWQFVRIQALSSPILFLLGFLAFVWYERPMRRYIERHHTGRADPSEAPSQVLRRLLNEPFFAVVLDLTIWILAAGFWTTFFWQKGEPAYILRRTFLINLNIGLITSVIAFFLLEHIFQKVLAPFFFPHGRIYEVPGTLRISIRVRLAALLFACNLVPFFATILVYLNLSATDGDPADILERLGDALTTNSLIFIIVGVWLWVLVSTNLSRPFRAIIRTLSRVREGHFDDRIQVTSNDELGYTGDVINQMTEGLKDREQMRLAMMLAREVQQNLLPRQDPQVDGLDIAGTSIYCDETGGDYYDYIRYETGTSEGSPLAVVVGDVSGHGVPSALLMATARALLRQRLSLPGDLAEAFSDVNCQLAQDVGVSGQFMTLMALAVNPVAGAIVWVRAGHDPAILYDPQADRFERLAGPGVALGVDTASRYTLQHRSNLVAGSILLLGTDGIWEACNAYGEMFGKERVLALIKRHAGASAGTIRDRLVIALKDFCGSSDVEDDITMVVIKLDRTAAPHQNTAGKAARTFDSDQSRQA